MRLPLYLFGPEKCWGLDYDDSCILIKVTDRQGEWRSTPRIFAEVYAEIELLGGFEQACVFLRNKIRTLEDRNLN